uniref:Uncharacterized protein n=1 Tax=Molossus molossus TaxID=27622 RepID=A0A7J8JWE0_MOLMO|nr:hypothetical protein HJG59_007871 [Molossus molossus]
MQFVSIHFKQSFKGRRLREKITTCKGYYNRELHEQISVIGPTEDGLCSPHSSKARMPRPPRSLQQRTDPVPRERCILKSHGQLTNRHHTAGLSEGGDEH